MGAPKGRWMLWFLIVWTCALGMTLFLGFNLGNSDTYSLPEIWVQKTYSMQNAYHVYSPACTIPNLDPFDKSVLKFYKTIAKVNCNITKPPATYQKGVFVHFNTISTDYANLTECEYLPIIKRDNKSDNTMKFVVKRSFRFKSSIEVNDEFVRVKCFDKDNNTLDTQYFAYILQNKALIERATSFKHKRISEKNTKEVLNIVLVGLDSVSRNNFIRQMPLTRAFLKNKLKAVELRGYNKVGVNTFPNLIPLTLGISVDELQSPKYNWTSQKSLSPYNYIWKQFAHQGYTTLYSEDQSAFGIFTYLKKGLTTAPTHHFARPFAIAMEKEKSMWSKRYCFGNRFETEIILNYELDFMRAYKESSHFAFTFHARMTHDRFNDAQVADEPHAKFLHKASSEGLLDNTVLFYISDHGHNYGAIRSTYVGRHEVILPAMYIVLPPRIRTQYPQLYENLQANSARLTSPFDIYATLQDILNFTGSPITVNAKARGISLLRQIPENRTCAIAGISEIFCACTTHVQQNISDAKVKKTAEYLVVGINELLGPSMDICVPINLTEIKTASASVTTSKAIKNETMNTAKSAVLDYLLVIKTSPGGALFEGTVRYAEHDESVSIIGDINRINTYAGQSDCVLDYKLRNYCYCRNLLHTN
jgi:hypothetical protein